MPLKENLTRLVKLKGCQYSISTAQMTTWFSYFGELLSPIVEDCFHDNEEDERINTLGPYSLKMKHLQGVWKISQGPL